MATYLLIHKDSGSSQQKNYRGRYELLSAGFILWRETGYRGAVSSGVKGGDVKVVLKFPGDAVLARWIFSDSVTQEGEVVTMDPHERTIEKFSFAGGRVKSYRIIYDSEAPDSLRAELVFSAAGIETDNDLFYERR